MDTFSNNSRWFLRKLDVWLSPPPNKLNLNYYRRIYLHSVDILHGRRMLRSMVSVLKISSMILASYILAPLILFLKFAGFRFVNIDITQIGSVNYLDLLLREDRLTRSTPRWKMYILGLNSDKSNKYLYDLYSPYVIFIRNPFLKLLFSPLFVSDLFDDNTFRFQTVHFSESNIHKIWREHRANFEAPLISMPVADRVACQGALSPFVPAGVPFVAVHVRDNGFYGVESQQLRNADIRTYELAFNYLIENGFYVIRFGDKNMVDIQEITDRFYPAFFDYAKSSIKSEMMDVYLLSQCAFFIGLASGPSGIPAIFDRPTCNVNWYNPATAWNFLSGDLTTFKTLRYKGSGEILPLEYMFEEPFSKNPSIAELSDLGLEIQDNTPEEILQTIREFLEFQRNPCETEIQAACRSLIQKGVYTYGSSGSFSNTILKRYIGKPLK